jgi:hypothetical protein
MRRVLSILTLAACVFFTAQPAQAARFTGNYLLQMCASDQKGKEIVKGGHAICQSYISGVLDYHSVARTFGMTSGVEFCVPDGTPLRSLQSAVAAYLYRKRAEHGSFIASPGVAMALASAYPCKK